MPTSEGNVQQALRAHLSSYLSEKAMQNTNRKRPALVNSDIAKVMAFNRDFESLVRN